MSELKYFKSSRNFDFSACHCDDWKNDTVVFGAHPDDPGFSFTVHITSKDARGIAALLLEYAEIAEAKIHRVPDEETQDA